MTPANIAGMAMVKGLDLIALTDHNSCRNCPALLAAAESGRLSQARLDQSVRRILTLKQDYGVTSGPVEAPDLEALNAQIGALTAG